MAVALRTLRGNGIDQRARPRQESFALAAETGRAGGVSLRQLLFYAPVLSIALNVLSVVCYLYLRDYPRSWYWALAALLTVSTLYMGKK
jgi:hypothetical protein